MELLNSPQRQADYIRGACTASESVGNLVYVSGAPVGEIYPVRLVDVWDEDKVPGVGVVVHKYSLTECLVQTGGPIRDVFTGLQRNKTYKAGPSGTIQVAPPIPGVSGYAYVQFIGFALASDVLFLRPEMLMSIRRAT